MRLLGGSPDPKPPTASPPQRGSQGCSPRLRNLLLLFPTKRPESQGHGRPRKLPSVLTRDPRLAAGTLESPSYQLMRKQGQGWRTQQGARAGQGGAGLGFVVLLGDALCWEVSYMTRWALPGAVGEAA